MKKILVILSILFYSSANSQDLSNIKIMIYPFRNSAVGNFDNFTKAEYYEKLLKNFGAEVILIDNRKSNLPLSQLSALANQNKVDFIHFIYNKDLVKTDENNYSLVIYNSFENFDVEEAGKLILEGISNSNRADNKYLSSDDENDLSGDLFVGLNAPGILSIDSKFNLSNKRLNHDYLKNEAWGYLRGILNFYETNPFNKGFIAGFVKDKNEDMKLAGDMDVDDYKPINNFKVTVSPGGKTYVGDFNNNGFYFIDSLNPGEYKLFFEAGTYSADSLLILVEQNQTTYADILLEKDFTIPPSVFNYAPSDTAIFVDTESPIKIVFSIPMDQETTEEAFTIEPEVDGKIEWSNEDHVMSFIPESAFDTSSYYEVLIDTSAKGKNNINLEKSEIFYFKTKNNYVEVVLKNADNNKDSILTTQFLEFDFSKPMSTSDTEDSFEIEPEVEGHFEWSADFTKMRFVPDNAYLTSTNYTVIIDENAETYNGLELGNDYKVEFVTQSSHLHPKVISVIPNDGSNKVFINSNINISFSEEIKNGEENNYFKIEPYVEGSFEWNSKFDKMSFIPDQLLNPDTDYKIILLNTAKNKYGIPLKENFEFSFTTNSRGRLKLLKNYPASNQKYISTTSKFYLQFNYAVDLNILIKNISLYSSDGNEIELANHIITENEGKYNVTFESIESLKSETDYNLFLNKDIKDDLNINLFDDIKIKFKTEYGSFKKGKIIDDFEELSNWINIDSNNASTGIEKESTFFEISDEKKISGNYSGKISYKFIKDKGLIKLNRSNPIVINNNGNESGIWFFGDLSNNILLIKLINEDSEYFDVFVDTLNWSGWKYKKFNLSGYTSQNLLLNSIMIKHISKSKSNGEIYFDDLQISENVNLTKVEDTIPNEFSLEQNYPNPFNPSTTISFRIPDPTIVSLDVLNILGQKVRNLISKENYAAGIWSIEWDGKSDYGEFMPSGVYLYKIRAAEFTEVKKMILIK